MMRPLFKFGSAALLAVAVSLSAQAHCGTCEDKGGDAKPGCKECAEDGFTVSVEGMHCPVCEAKVKKALEGVKGVKSAKACHKAGKVCVVMADAKGVLTKEDAEKALAGTEFKVTAVAKCAKKEEKKN